MHEGLTYADNMMRDRIPCAYLPPVHINAIARYAIVRDGQETLRLHPLSERKQTVF
jgi:hypothetical protein